MGKDSGSARRIAFGPERSSAFPTRMSKRRPTPHGLQQRPPKGAGGGGGWGNGDNILAKFTRTANRHPQEEVP